MTAVMYAVNYDMKFSCYGLYSHLDTELLYANLVHHVVPAKGSEVNAGSHP
jgi:hypothetical protein